MERKLIARGVFAGAIGGLLAFVFARIFAERLLNTAISYESGRDAAQAALDRAAGLSLSAEGPEIYTRTLQSTVGIGVGMMLFARWNSARRTRRAADLDRPVSEKRVQ